MKLEEKIIHLLTQRKEIVSIAESCTGGLLGQRLTSISGASKVFGFGVISYSRQAKQKLLNISPSLIKKHGEVSQQTAQAMAQGIQRLSQSDYALSVTGIAGPTGGTAQKPVGTVCFSLISQKGRHIKNKTLHFSGSRSQIRRKASTAIFKILVQALTKRRTS
ncbi:MAG: nicotinamide-nucleotide amidohydrolase family protein [Deltaproteobacteria bacterium]|nr:nicotinamide-nucleotide amidohydrolase family protein [Deltaproteobacteria bacterium]